MRRLIGFAHLHEAMFNDGVALPVFPFGVLFALVVLAEADFSFSLQLQAHLALNNLEEREKCAAALNDYFALAIKQPAFLTSPHLALAV